MPGSEDSTYHPAAAGEAESGGDKAVSTQQAGLGGAFKYLYFLPYGASDPSRGTARDLVRNAESHV